MLWDKFHFRNIQTKSNIFRKDCLIKRVIRGKI